jgi:NAD(P)-dependent dehydrogenase (short-subunit alcohol dehydrogenase family)
MPDKATTDGYEQQMQTNHLSHCLLSSLLFPSLEKAAAMRGQARIVNQSSCARLGGQLKAANLEKGTAWGGDSVAARYERYHQTKLANMVFTQALQVCTCHPLCHAVTARTCPPSLCHSGSAAGDCTNVVHLCTCV